MKVSGFTFIRNGLELGFPFLESIQSILPILDEMIIVVGESTDNTLSAVTSIDSPKIRIIQSRWNEQMTDRGFVYAQQKMIAQFLCTGDWIFYLEGDELVHENDLSKITASINLHHTNPEVEALVFDYYHFYGSPDWIAISPEWYRRECRLLRNTVRWFAPDGQYWVVMNTNRKGRHPKAALANAHIYHYGHVRRIEFLQKKIDQVSKYWGTNPPKVQYGIDPRALKPFAGTHPELICGWLSANAEYSFIPSSTHKLRKREIKHRWLMRFEKLLRTDLSRKHYKLVS